MASAFAALFTRYQNELKLFSLSINVTRRCDLACQHCYLAERTGGDEAPVDLFEQALADARQLDALALLLTGGEVFLRRDWPRLLAATRRHNFFTSIFSHAGFIDDALAQQLRAHGVYDVGISFFSMDPAVHDQVTQRPGSHARTRRGIEALVRAGLHVTLKTSVLRGINEQGIDAVRSWAATLGPSDRVRHEVTFTFAARTDGDLAPCAFVPSLDRCSTIARQNNLVTPIDGVAAAHKLEQLLVKPPCAAASSALHIEADGTVRTCMLIPTVVGDLRRESLIDIWQRLQERRRREGVFLLKDFSVCRRCRYLTRCTPCLGHLGPTEHAHDQAPRMSCINTYAAVTAEQPAEAAALPLPPGLVDKPAL